MLKNNNTPEINWQPSASISNLRLRAFILQKIRDFFAERKVLEVETPLLCRTSVTDPHIQSIKAYPLENDVSYYLQTSPEYAMKRLLAAGSGSIYQITKAFRQAEVGKIHNPEFTLLEWYRVGFCHHQLMDETDELLQKILSTKKAERKTYAEIFQTYLNLNPHQTTIQELKHCISKENIFLKEEIIDKDTLLNILMTHCIEPKLGYEKPCFVYDYPASQAVLARIPKENPQIASRFELYIQGMELANGFHELQGANEHRARFEENIKYRNTHGLPPQPIDEFFLAAIHHELPECAGIALGIDRLIMLAVKTSNISDVLSFDFSKV